MIIGGTNNESPIICNDDGIVTSNKRILSLKRVGRSFQFQWILGVLEKLLAFPPNTTLAKIVIFILFMGLSNYYSSVEN